MRKIPRLNNEFISMAFFDKTGLAIKMSLSLFILFIFVLNPNPVYGQLGISGYPTFTQEDGKLRFGGGMGMGFRKNITEYWMNLEIYGFYRKDTVYIDPYGYIPPMIEKKMITDVDLMFLYHKEILFSFAAKTGIYPFWELGTGLSIRSSEHSSGSSGYSGGDNAYQTKVLLAFQPGAGFDIKRKFRIRCNPYYKLGSHSISGIQFSMFLLFGLAADQVKEEIIR